MEVGKVITLGLTVFISLCPPHGAVQPRNLITQRNDRDVNFYLERGDQKMQSGDYRGAIADYNQVIKINRQNASAYSNRGAARSALGDKKGAIEDYSQALKINPQDWQAYYRRGNDRSELGDKKGAIEDYGQALKINPQFTSALKSRQRLEASLGKKQPAKTQESPGINKQVTALVGALRKLAPQTPNSSDLLSPWKVKRENISPWAKFCQVDISPEEFAQSAEKAKLLVTCIVADLLKEEMANSNNQEEVAILRAAAWWMTGDGSTYGRPPTANYAQQVLATYKKLLSDRG